jgi:hypothetical protein
MAFSDWIIYDQKTKKIIAIKDSGPEAARFVNMRNKSAWGSRLNYEDFWLDYTEVNPGKYQVGDYYKSWWEE